jgi:DNA-binding response OmpR family regulator/tRNA A-37 threonylcarbamoyl transferase component Bud32
MVEDDVGLATLVRHYLEHESYTVKSIHDGIEAQTYILANPADLIILDWDLPGLSGIEILRDYRSFGGLSPVILLTGHNSVENKEQGFDDGADDYLTKPFNLKELGARVKRLLRRTQAAIGNIATVGDIVVDLDTSKVLKAGRAVTLVPREFQLVAYLVKNRKDVPTSEELLERVWTSDAEMTPESFYTVVRRVAKKLDPDGRMLRIDGIMNSAEFKMLSGDTLTLSGNQSDSGIYSDAEDPMIGRILDNKYEIIKAIGSGASGRVYKGKHKSLNTIVAVKVLAPQLSTHPELVKRFEREARAVGLLSHTNILVVYDLGQTDESQPYMVMEYLNGFSLAQLLERNGKLAIPDCIEIVSQICLGMSKAHNEGLIHRDLKPGNIMLIAQSDHSFIVKIVDFGLAKLIRPDENENLTRTGSMIGTPSYMSPEQCRSEPTDHRADIYAIGCMMYEMLIGSKPFEASNMIDVYIKHAQDPPPLLVLADADDETTKRLEQIVHRCLQKSRDERYQSADDLLTDLANACTQLK